LSCVRAHRARPVGANDAVADPLSEPFIGHGATVPKAGRARHVPTMVGGSVSGGPAYGQPGLGLSDGAGWCPRPRRRTIPPVVFLAADDSRCGGKRPRRSSGGAGCRPISRRLVERALSAELTEHLGYEPPGGTGNARNGTTPNTLATECGPVAIKTFRDRNSSFEPKIVREGQRRLQGFDDNILKRRDDEMSPGSTIPPPGGRAAGR
jgi:hypothetical protein